MAGELPLDGVTVLDLTHHTAGPFCTRLLTDYGADVVKIERPGGDPARALPPFLGDRPGPERSGLFLSLNTGKRSVVLDLATAEGRGQALALAATADVVVENFRPGTLERLGLGYETLRAVNPRLVLTSLSNFGQDGPYRDYEATDLTLYAMGGPMQGSGHMDREPLKSAGRAIGYHGGYVAALATVTALRAAEQHGSGEQVDVSIFEAATHSIDMRLGQLIGYQFTGRVAQRPSLVSQVGSGVYPCGDGFFVFTAGATRLPGMMRMIGRPELLEQPEWESVAARSEPERIEEFQVHLLPWTLEHSKREIREACEQFGVLGAPLNTIADLLDDPNFREREFFQQIDHPETGPLTYPGYHFTLHREGEPMPPRRRAPLLGEHTAEVLAGIEAQAPAPPVPAAPSLPAPSLPPPAEPRGGLPLDGVRILDFTVVWAGPYATMNLADWGAEVIRVESTSYFASSTRGQLARPPQEMVLAGAASNIGYPDDEPGEQPWNRWAGFAHHARNKRSVTVDLSTTEGQEALDRLIAQADGIIENNLPPNAEERLGLTWERVSQVNPRAILLRIPGFGISGPYRAYRTFGNHMEALCGHPTIRSYPDLSLEYAPGGVPSDAASGIGGAFAFTLGLRYRERTGGGC